MITSFNNILLAIMSSSILLGAGCTGTDGKKNADSGIPVPPPAFEVEYVQPLPDRPVRVGTTPYAGPIIDTHLHIAPPRGGVIVRSKLRDIIKTIDDLNLEGMIFMPTPNEGRFPNHKAGVRQRQMLRSLGKGKIKLFCGSDYISVWLHNAYRQGYAEEDLKQILQRLSGDLDSGKYIGVGEIGIYHFKKLPHQKMIAYPPNFEPFLKILNLIAQKRVWLDLHAEPIDHADESYEDILFGGLELWFRLNPDLKLILSHTAMTNPSNARGILQTYPNVMMNIKFEKYGIWEKLGPIVSPERKLYEDWAALFEEMPERFMIGTDEVSGVREFNVETYRKRINQVRRILLGAINPDAARLIAHENARKLFK